MPKLGRILMGDGLSPFGSNSTKAILGSQILYDKPGSAIERTLQGAVSRVDYCYFAALNMREGPAD
jgi:hypothetical protein